ISGQSSSLAFSLFGQPPGGFVLTFGDLAILMVIAIAVNATTVWLTSRKIGSLSRGIIVTIIGALLTVAFIRLPFDFRLQDIPVFTALIGSIIVGVFYTLIRARLS